MSIFLVIFAPYKHKLIFLPSILLVQPGQNANRIDRNQIKTIHKLHNITFLFYFRHKSLAKMTIFSMQMKQTKEEVQIYILFLYKTTESERMDQN